MAADNPVSGLACLPEQLVTLLGPEGEFPDFAVRKPRAGSSNRKEKGV